MPEIVKHAPGSFCWAEVGTVDAQKTKAFYGQLFGWKYEDRPAREFGTYTMVKTGGKDLAGLYELSRNLLKRGVRPHWMPYVAVASADAACEKIQKHGGSVQQGPFDVMDAGRMAICTDPTGATFSVWQPKTHAGASIMGESGTPCWFELATRGVERAEGFYKDVFGWSVKTNTDVGMVYREFSPPDAPMPQGGMMELTPQHGPIPPHWMIYFMVDDCDRDAKRCQSLGGKVLLPPKDIPNVGRFAVLADPAGAAFSIIKLAFDPATHTTADQPLPPAAVKPRKKKKK